MLDTPFTGMPTRLARRRLKTILKAAGERTVIVALSRAIGIENFDRVLMLKNGKIRFDGTRSSWDDRKPQVASAK